jgi:hypothetical protein
LGFCMAASLAAFIADDVEEDEVEAEQPAAASAAATARAHPRMALDRSFRRPDRAPTGPGCRRIMPTDYYTESSMALAASRLAIAWASPGSGWSGSSPTITPPPCPQAR